MRACLSWGALMALHACMTVGGAFSHCPCWGLHLRRANACISSLCLPNGFACLHGEYP